LPEPGFPHPARQIVGIICFLVLCCMTLTKGWGFFVMENIPTCRKSQATILPLVTPISGLLKGTLYNETVSHYSDTLLGTGGYLDS